MEHNLMNRVPWLMANSSIFLQIVQILSNFKVYP